jgi:hypothetical protein
MTVSCVIKNLFIDVNYWVLHPSVSYLSVFSFSGTFQSKDRFTHKWTKHMKKIYYLHVFGLLCFEPKNVLVLHAHTSGDCDLVVTIQIE